MKTAVTVLVLRNKGIGAFLEYCSPSYSTLSLVEGDLARTQPGTPRVLADKFMLIVPFTPALCSFAAVF
ncbi:hypothetical protein THAOC_23547, partial [Thalassiosira oceanica]